MLRIPSAIEPLPQTTGSMARNQPPSSGYTFAMQFTFSPMSASEVSPAHALYNRSFDWLAARGVRQWLLRLDEATFSKRQAAGEAFIFYVDGALAGCAFLPFETLPYYGDALRTTPHWWMHTLIVDRAFAGRGVGRMAVAAVRDRVRAHRGDALWLHCVNDANHAEVMPQYYAALEFAEVLRAELTYPSGNAFPMVVMRKAL